MALEVRLPCLDATTMLHDVRTDHLDHTKGLPDSLGEMAPAVTGRFHRVHGVDNHASADCQTSLGNRMRDHVRRQARRLLAGDPGPHERSFDGIDTEIGRRRLLCHPSCERRLTGAWQSAEDDEHPR